MSDTPKDHNATPDYLLLGQVTRPHGVRGELKMRILTDYPDRVGQLDTVYLSRHTDGKDADAYTVLGMRMNKKAGLLRVEKVNNRETADRLRKKFVLVAISDAIPLEDDEFYLFQVLGMTVELEGGEVLGTVRDVIETGANDVYIVDSPEYGDVLFPITDETLIDHDMDSGIVHLKLIDGLLPDKS